MADQIKHSSATPAPASAVVPITPAATDLPFGPCRGLLVGTAGTATIRDGLGVTRTDVPLQAGYNPIAVQAVTALGTAANLWALY